VPGRTLGSIQRPVQYRIQGHSLYQFNRSRSCEHGNDFLSKCHNMCCLQCQEEPPDQFHNLRYPELREASAGQVRKLLSAQWRRQVRTRSQSGCLREFDGLSSQINGPNTSRNSIPVDAAWIALSRLTQTQHSNAFLAPIENF
jgi:hypothetical protein